MTRIGIVVGSTRPGPRGEQVAHRVVGGSGTTG